LPDISEYSLNSLSEPDAQTACQVRMAGPATSFGDLYAMLARHWRAFAWVVGGLMLLCLLYCLAAPRQYEAVAKVALRTSPESSLNLEPAESFGAPSAISASLQQETLANVLRSDRLAWTVITELQLHKSPAFRGWFAYNFPDFHTGDANPDAEAYLLRRFRRSLRVQTVPRTLLIQIRFRSRDGALSAAVANALVHAYTRQELEQRQQATAQSMVWLQGQLADLKAGAARDQQRLADFQKEHGILSTPELASTGAQGEAQHSPALLEVDELGRQLIGATTERTLREAQFRAARQGDPEAVLVSDSSLQAADGGFATSLLQQIQNRRSTLAEELAKRSAEDGPNFPRVVEIRQQIAELDRQKQAEDSRLLERFRVSLQTATEHEQALLTTLAQYTDKGLKLSQASSEYVAMRQEAVSRHDLYMRVLEKSEEAGMAAGVQSSNISLVDEARLPVKPASPDMLLDLSVTFFVSLWLALAVALLLDSLSARRAVALLAVVILTGMVGAAQAPTPSTSGLPTGVAHIPLSEETRSVPDSKDAPTVWARPDGASQAGLPAFAPAELRTPMQAPIGPGDFLDISEFHTPEFHTAVRVSAQGTVSLPMIMDVRLAGLDEQQAARAIEAALLAQGMLLHPKVSVQVTGYAGQDVSVFGEVVRPGVYPYTQHHRLLDLISAASGLSPTAGRLVTIFHREDAKTPHPVLMDPDGSDGTADHNPELLAGDTVQVSRSGLVYVIGDVIRPGGFPIDPGQHLTILQALSLAWGPSQNAASSRAILIREQSGGRIMTTLDLKRMLKGRDPDQVVRDRDILFVPDSTAKNLLNRTLEAAIQSAVGVSIYAGLVYSQRF
jgi:polysaccharide export outer membrane protein